MCGGHEPPEDTTGAEWDGWGACTGVLNPADDESELDALVAPPEGWDGTEMGCDEPFVVCDTDREVDGWLERPGSALAMAADRIPPANKEPRAR
jgi:hypothetical protein